MFTKVETYNLIRFTGKKIKKMAVEIEKIDAIENCLFEQLEDKTWILKVNYTFENEISFSNKVKRLVKQILRIIQKYEKKAEFVIQEEEEVYRRVVYLKGLDCAHCAARIESIAKKQFNHEQLIVDFATTRFIIETKDEQLAEDIVEEVTNVAHRVDPRIIVQESHVAKKTFADEEKKKVDVLFIVLTSLGLLCLIVGIILDLEHVLHTFVHHLNPFESHQHELNSLLDVFKIYPPVTTILLLVAFILLSYKVLINFFKNLIKGHFLDENFLMTIACFGALMNAYFFEAISIMVLFQIGEMIQERVVNNSRKSISNLLMLDVKKAKIKVKGEIIEVDVETIIPGDIVVVKKGEMIPLDSELISDYALLDTKNITGESLQRHAKAKEQVYSGSINMSDTIEIKALKVYSDSMIMKILDSVQNATSIKSKSEKFITKFSKIYTPIVVGAALLIALYGFIMGFVIPKVINQPVDFNEILTWVYRGSIFLVISCPCALVISIPLCYFKGLGLASSRGILVKGSNYLESLSKVKKIVFDKTGTITTGEFTITQNVPVKEGITEKDLLKFVAYTEYYASHPVGIALVEMFGRQNVFTEIITEFKDIQSRGCTAVINGNKYCVGSHLLMKENGIDAEVINANGLVVYIARNKEYLGYIVVGDKIRDNAADVIKSLRKQGIDEVSIFTGDNQRIGEYVGALVGANKTYTGLLPDQKVEKLKELKANLPNQKENIAFIGDGLNDAPVIASADIGIAIGSGASDATIAISDVVIMNENIAKVEELVYIARKTKQRVIQNIVFCLVIKIIIMILNFIPGVPVPVWLAIFSDVGVSLIAIANSMIAMRRFKKEEKKLNVQESKEDEEE